MITDLQLAKICQLAYQPNKAENFGTCEIAFHQIKDTLVVCMVGSDDKLDWLCNFDLGMEPWQHPGLIHKGFHWIARVARHSIQLKLNLFKFNELVLVGHSLGGALATILSVYLIDKYPNLRVVTFGSPNPFDEVGAISYKANALHYINGDDPFPFLLDHYGHLRNRKILGKRSSGLIVPRITAIKGALVDHKIHSYISELEKC